MKLFVLFVLRRAILSSMPQRSVIGSTPFASQSGEIGNYCFFSCFGAVSNARSVNSLHKKTFVS